LATAANKKIKKFKRNKKMKTVLKLHMVLLCLFISMQISFAQVLEKRVTIQFQNITLDQALRKIKNTYGVNFSYSPDQIDLTQKVSLNVKNTRLGDALDQLFKPTPITYKAVGNQIVLKKGKVATGATGTTGTKSTQAKKPIDSDTLSKSIALQDSTANKKLELEYKPLVVVATDSATAIKELDITYSQELSVLNVDYSHKKDSINTEAFTNKTTLKENWKNAKIKLANEYRQLRDSIMYAKRFKDIEADTAVVVDYDEDLLIQDDFQFTGVYPLGTHMDLSGLYRNDVSTNLLVGYNGAVSAFEFGCVGNIVRKEVHGGQLAGAFNVVGEYVRGAQVAGVTNVVKQEVIGAQVAGVVNYAGGAMSGAQIAGAVNVGTEQLDGIQLAGAVNQHDGTINGGQIGIVNHARKVKGFQLGIINVCDTIQGVPIGLLSIAKNGYGRVEGYFSETTQGNIVFKSGVKTFYNIFQFGVNAYTDSTSADAYRWTFGYGFGSTIQMSKRTTLTFDLIAMHINENEAFTDVLNEQAQLRILFGVNLSKRVSLFAGPTLNTVFSEYVNSEGTVGSGMIPKNGLLYEQTLNDNGKQIYNPYWIGFNAGIRF
jgi:hypothetical protein